MNRILYRKINLLIHLAHIDGKFHHSEKDLLISILKESGLEGSYLEQHKSEAVNFEDLQNIPGKEELLFWVMKLIHADGQLHFAELAFAKAIAQQLGFRAELIDYYKNRPIESLADFENGVKSFQTQHP